MRSLHGAAGVRSRTQSGLLPTIPWSVAAAACTWAALMLLLSGIAFAAAALAPYADAANVERITLERSGCFGSCPAYRLTLGADGRAMYEGRLFVRDRGTYEARFEPRAFPRVAHTLAQLGMFVVRSQHVIVEDVSKTTLAITFADGTVAKTTAFVGLPNDDVADDMFVAAFFIDGFAGHICGWHRVAASTFSDSPSPGSYSPISTAPCRRIGQR